MSTENMHHEPEYGTGKKTLSVYVIGLILCLVLTLIPFEMTEHYKSLAQTSITSSELLSHKKLLLFVLFICAILQFFVQVICFLRLSSRTEQGKTNIYSFVFSIVVLIVLVGGSLWIMHSLNYNMMH